MIGQKYIRSFIYEMANKHCVPRFLLLVGDSGSGRKTLAQDVARYMNEREKAESGNTCNSYMLPDVKIETIRTMLDNSYKQKTPMVYIVPDIDNMSQAAQNAILKVTEEPPNKAYFIMTAIDVDSILPTIKSRAFTLWMDKYSMEEIEEYALGLGLDPDDVEAATTLCETPGEVNTFKSNNGCELVNFAYKVVNNITTVSTANALKILNELDIKEEGKGYDVCLFLKLFIKGCVKNAIHETDKSLAIDYIFMVSPTGKALANMKVKGANKNMILTNWIFDIRS